MKQQDFVVLDGITKRWSGQLGVADISISIPRGAFVALLGPSGCGKSTTLRLLAGLETADEGKILIEGHDVTTAAPSDRNLSMVFQSYALFPHLSVAENVVFGLKVRRVPKVERQQQLHNALEITGLLGLEDRKPGELSGGQRQRVALARAIVAGQPLCLMDEPLSNLDAKLRHSVRKDIKKLQRDLGITVVYVTHDQTEAMSMADMIVLMKDGHIQQTGTPEQLYNEPASTFVAEFVGAPPMALIKGNAFEDHFEGETIGVRAEHITLAEPMRTCFGDSPWMPKSGKINWLHDLDGVRLIGLDTLIPGRGGGILDRETLDFLATSVQSAGNKALLIAMHHPPFETGLWFMDRIGLEGIAPLSEILNTAQAEVRIICGHVHSTIISSVGPHIAVFCPSVASSFLADFRANSPAGFVTGSTGYGVHDWNNGFRSGVVPLITDPVLHPF